MKLLMSVSKGLMTPDTEGQNHINIYSKSKTVLGRYLSHFQEAEINTQDGLFMSIEAYWYWLKYRDEDLRTLSGYEAKTYGSSLAKHRTPMLSPDTEEFKNKILFATNNKLNNMPDILRSQLAESRLPLIHAYVHQGKYTFQNSMDFIIASINQRRLQGTLK